MKTYLVGGYVRDKLLNQPSKDLDYVVVGGDPQFFIDNGYKQVGADFPVFLHPETGDEYALARKERKVGTGYHGFTCDYDPSITLEEDLYRRDLTINALALDKNGKVIDFFNGVQDIKDKKLRHVSEHFKEDPLRLLRVARFLARYGELGFEIHEDTKALMKQMVLNGEVDNLTAERVKLETDKALLEPNPELYFEALRECGALNVIFPEIDALFGVPQPEQHHPEIDSGVHTLLVLKQARSKSDSYENKKDKLVLLWSALLHDLGKGITPKYQLPRHIGHEKSGVPLVEDFAKRLRLTKEEEFLAKETSRHHLIMHTIKEVKPDTTLRLFKSLNFFRNPKYLDIFIDACESDAKGRTGLESRPYPQKAFLQEIAKSLSYINESSIAKKVAADPGIPKNKRGVAINERVNHQRVNVIQSTRSLLNNPDKFKPITDVNNHTAEFIRLNLKSIQQLVSNPYLANKHFNNPEGKPIFFHKLVNMVDTINNIDVQKIIEKGFKNQEIGNEINRQKNIIIHNYAQSIRTKSSIRKGKKP